MLNGLIVVFGYFPKSGIVDFLLVSINKECTATKVLSWELSRLEESSLTFLSMMKEATICCRRDK